MTAIAPAMVPPSKGGSKPGEGSMGYLYLLKLAGASVDANEPLGDQIMVGDLQRLIVYGQKGWSAPQDVPPEVLEAYEGLVAAGYTGRLIPHST